MKSSRYLTALACLCALSACTSTPSQHKEINYPKAHRAAHAPAATDKCDACDAAAKHAATAPIAATPSTPAAPVIPAPAPVIEATTPPMTIATAPVQAATSSANIEVPAAVIPVAQPVLNAVLSGETVKLTWTLPAKAATYKRVEIMRNSVAAPQGRNRIRSVRATETSIEDAVGPNPPTLWYWIKLIDLNDVASNVGPVSFR
jgi:hypothetical protein